MKRLFSSFFCLWSLSLAAVAQPGKPAAAPPAQPAAPAPAPTPAARSGPGFRAGDERPAQVAVARYTGQLSPEPAQFIIDVRTMLLSTNNAAAQAVGEQLRKLWGSNQLTASQQRRIAELSQLMLDKKLKPTPHLTTFFMALLGAKSGRGAALSDQQTDQLLEVLAQTLTHDSPADVVAFLTNTARLLTTGYLHRSGYNNLRLPARDFTFAYRPGPPAGPDPNASFDAPTPPAPAPKPGAAAGAPARPAPSPAPPAAPGGPTKPVKLMPGAVRAKFENATGPAPRKRASDGWDTADPWAAAKPAKKAKPLADDDGWGPPILAAPPKPKPKPKPTAARPAAAPAPKPAEPAPAPPADEFNASPAPFVPGPAAAFDPYLPPQVTGPVLELKNTDLVLTGAGDSLVLKQLSGVVSLRAGAARVVASGAHLDWTIRQQPVAADLGPFDFETGKPEFTAQPSTLTYAARLEAPVKGALTYRAVRRRPGAEATYPRFISLTNDARLKDLGPGFSYRGGVALAGPQLASAALDGSASTLRLTQDGQARFRAVSRNFLFSDSTFSAGRTAVTLYVAKVDSITHPGVELKYARRSQELKLLHTKGVYRTTPYADSYHEVDIGAQMVDWKLADPKMEFSIITTPTEVAAPFESHNFFSNVRYQRTKTINRLHPLQLLVNYSNTHGRPRQINLRTVADELKLSEDNLRSAARGLAQDGYVHIVPETGEVELLPKGKHYVGAAREKKDYDHLSIKSLTGSGRSATLNLASNELTIRGVKQFSFVADSAKSPVLARPDSGLVRMGRNRDLRFGGRVLASIYGFRGQDFAFNYDGFYIDMPRIDSLTIRKKPTKDQKQTADGVALTTKFTLTNKGKYQSGRLFLNDVNNRSGRKKREDYPKFTSTSGAFVYFNKPDVLGGAYDSTTYFDVPPFSFDSMGTGRSTGQFRGVFHSAALPPITTTLSTQPDGSMGFVHIVPKDGYPLYGGKGRLSGGARVQFNAGGLQSNGTVTYLGASLQSDRFVMYTDSLTGIGKTGAIAGANVPKVVLPPNFFINWGAKRDSLHLRTPPGAVAKVYNDHTFKGSLLLTPKVVGGAGRLDGPQSYVRSKSLVFTNDTYQAGNALLSIKSTQAGKPAMVAQGMKLSYDLKRGYASFEREPESKATIELPFTDFRSSLTAGRWDFKRKKVELRASGTDSLGSYFTSTRPDQLGLKFKAGRASYDLAKYKLSARDVPYIAIADSWVLPDSGRVAVLPGGKFQQMQRARVLMDSVTKFHQLYLGNLTIKDRVRFEGQAKYTFKYANGDSVALTFSDFRPDSGTFRSVASAGRKRGGLLSLGRKPTPELVRRGVSLTGAAKVGADDKFNLAPNLAYRGEVTLNSQRRGLAFEGEVRLGFSKTPSAAEWVAMRDTVNPKNIAIDLKDAKAPDGQPLVAGIFMSDDAPGLFPLYFGALPNSLDYPVVKVDGTLRYQTQTGVYSLSREDLLDPKQREGAALQYDEKKRQLSWRGPLQLLASKKNFTMVGAATGTAAPDSGAYRMRALMGFDIVMPPKAIEVLAAGLNKFSQYGYQAIGGDPDDATRLAQLAGNAAAENFLSRKPGQAPDALQKLSPKLLHTLVLNRADLRWSPEQRAWYSVGRLGVGGVGKQAMNMLMEGLLEVKRVDGQDYVELYLEPAPGVFYYFRYEKDVLVVQSYDDKFNYEVNSKARYDASVATEYGAFLGELGEVESFRSRFRKTYLGESAKAAAARRKATAAAEEALAAQKAAEEEAAAAAAEAKRNKKRKNNEAEPDPNADPGAGEPPVETNRKKKKAKDNDPFGDGVIEAPGAVPAPKPAPKPAAPKPADKPGADKAAAPAKPADKAAAKPTAPADSTATKKPAPLSKKERKAAEKAAQETADPNAEPPTEPTTEPDKKSKKKKKDKQAAEDDPFGGN